MSSGSGPLSASVSEGDSKNLQAAVPKGGSKGSKAMAYLEDQPHEISTGITGAFHIVVGLRGYPYGPTPLMAEDGESNFQGDDLGVRF